MKLSCIGSKEGRERLINQLGVDAGVSSDELWPIYKKWIAGNRKTLDEYLQKIIEQYAAPEAVVRHARRDSEKEYYSYGYQYLIELLSEEKMRQRQKELEKIEAELASYTS